MSIGGDGAPSRRPIAQMPDGEIVGMVDEWFGRVTQGRRHVERWALLGTAFMLDQQYVDFHGTRNSMQLVQTPHKRNRVRTQENLIEPAVRVELARLLRNRPLGTVVPDGMDDEDLEAAQAADDALQHVQRIGEWEEHLEEAVQWAVMAGTSLIGTGWDAERGRLVDPTEQEMAEAQQTGEQPEPRPEGQTYFRALSPFEFGVPQLRTTRLQDQPYVMVTKAYESWEVEERWGIKVEPDDKKGWTHLDERLTHILSASSSGGGINAEHNVPMSIVKETWIKPSMIAPEGAVIITAGSSILDLTPLPAWCDGRYPFAKLEFTRIPGSFWGKGLINALIPLQRRHNRAASVVVETLNQRAIMSMAAPRNTQVRAALGGKAAIFETPPGSTQPVTNLLPPPLDNLPFQELEHTKAAFADITFQHEVTKGTTPSNVRAASAINALKEYDDAASSIPIRAIERASEHLGDMVLRMVKEKWTEPRMVEVMSEEGDLERRSFVGSEQVRGHYAVQRGSAWPFTKAEKQGMVTQALQYGIIGPEQAAKYLDMGGTLRDMTSEQRLDERHARRENQRFEDAMLRLDEQTGQPDIRGYVDELQSIAPADWHNHMEHIRVHNHLRKSPKYDRMDPYKKMALDFHINAHLAALQAMQVGGGMVGPGMIPAPMMAEGGGGGEGSEEAPADE